ncbi:MAG: protein kinase [Myxococcota bacterium]
MSGTDPMLGVKAQEQPSVVVEDSDPLIGLNLGGFVVKKLLASGGMGLVYEALHEQIGRRAAVKVLKPEVAADQDWTRRFLTEAQALASLKNKNLIEVLNFGKTPDGREFLMMEFLEGEALDHYIARMGALAPAVALGIAEQILNALSEAHKKGVVHRDLKPSNVFLLREHSGELLVKVIDFGLARQEPVKLLDAALSLPKAPDGASLLAGTPEYIAPEQAQGLKVDHAADLYSLGIMLYEMLSGSLPFEADSVTALLQKHLSERPPRLSAQVNNLPEGIEELVEQLLEKEPSKRPSSADAARVLVQRLLKRLSMDSTAVRVDPKHLPTIKIERAVAPATTSRAPTESVSPAPQSPTTDLSLAKPRGRRGGLYAGLVALVLLAVGGGYALTQSPEVVEAPPVVVTPPPEPVAEKPAPLPEPVAVRPQPEPDIAPLPEVPASPQVTRPPAKAVPPVTSKVVVTKAPEPVACRDLGAWRVSMKNELQRLETYASKNDALFDAFEKARKGFNYLDVTDSPGCAKVEKNLDQFYATHGLAR